MFNFDLPSPLSVLSFFSGPVTSGSIKYVQTWAQDFRRGFIEKYTLSALDVT